LRLRRLGDDVAGDRRGATGGSYHENIPQASLEAAAHARHDQKPLTPGQAVDSRESAIVGSPALLGTAVAGAKEMIAAKARREYLEVQRRRRVAPVTS
jgi:hypothetical protein